jgi:hypothetical protein
LDTGTVLVEKLQIRHTSNSPLQESGLQKTASAARILLRKNFSEINEFFFVTA